MKTKEQLQSLSVPSHYGLLSVIVVDQFAIVVQPMDADAYDSPARVCGDCIALAKKFDHPVQLHDKTNVAVTITP